jgi:hypothetical protein
LGYVKPCCFSVLFGSAAIWIGIFVWQIMLVLYMHSNKIIFIFQ